MKSRIRFFSEETLNGDAFDDNMKAKGSCIDELDLLDEGFQSLYDRIKEELAGNKTKYSSEIAAMKQLIKEVTELGAKIEVQEAHNKSKGRSNVQKRKTGTQRSKEKCFYGEVILSEYE